MIPINHMAEFKENVLEAQIPVLLACLRCELNPEDQLQLLSNAARDYGDGLRICVVDAQQSNGFRNEYRVMGTPTYLLFEKGKEVDRMLGRADQRSLYMFLDHVLGLPRQSMGNS